MTEPATRPARPPGPASHRPATRTPPWRRVAAVLGTAACAGLVPLGPAVATPSGDGVAVAGAQRAGAGGGTPWWYDAMQIRAAHRQATGKGVTVALIDGTLDRSLPELRGADVSIRRDCDGHRPESRPGSEQFHGSSMAAFLVGSGRGRPGAVRGVAPDATLLFYGLDTVAEPAGEPAFIECNALQMGQTVDRAVRDGADVISISIGGGKSSVLERALHRASAAGAVVVASTGNTASHTGAADLGIEWPAGYPGVVGVNAADRAARAWVNNPPPSLAIADAKKRFPVATGPGVDVPTAAWVPGRGWATVPETGTSISTAIVAGSLALVKSRYPQVTGNQLIQSLIHSTGGSGPFDWDRYFGFGFASPTAMLKRDPRGWPDVNPLMHGPQAAVRAYPMSSYHRPASTTSGPSASPGAAAEPAADAAPTSGSPADSPAESSADSPAGNSAGSPAATGPPGWLWPGLAGMLAAGAAVALLATRGARRRRTTDRTTTDRTTTDVPAQEG